MSFAGLKLFRTILPRHTHTWSFWRSSLSVLVSVFMCVTQVGRDDPPNPNTLTHILPLQCFNNPSHKSIVAFPTQCPPHVATLTVNQIIYDWFPKSWSIVIQASLLCCLRGCDARKSPTCARACFWLHRSRSRNSKLRVRPHICLTRQNKPKKADRHCSTGTLLPTSKWLSL